MLADERVCLDVVDALAEPATFGRAPLLTVRLSPDDGKVVLPEGGFKYFVRLWDISSFGNER